MAYIEHSIFGATAPDAVYGTYNDLGEGGLTGSNFYTYAPVPDGLVLIGGRIWVPPNNSAPWNTGELQARMGYYFQTPGNGAIGTFTNFISDILQAWHATLGPPITIVSGAWNEYRLPVPIPLGAVGDGIAIGWLLDNGTFYVAAPYVEGATPARDGFHAAMAEHQIPGVTRGQFGNWISPTQVDHDGWAFNGAHYGADIIIGVPDATPIPSGSFAGTYGWGPAGASGVIPVSGSFGGQYGWRPAEAIGSATATGQFASQYGWGVAVMSGHVTAGGGFTGQYGWRPATSMGQTDRFGVFSSSYGWGPAIALGNAGVGGEFGGTYGWGPARFSGFSGEILPFPVCDFDLTPTAMGLFLEGFAPEMTLEGSCSP